MPVGMIDRALDLGGTSASLLAMAAVRVNATRKRVIATALLWDTAILGGLAGLGAIAGFGYEHVVSHPGAVLFTFLFAFFFQALRYLARERGLEPGSSDSETEGPKT